MQLPSRDRYDALPCSGLHIEAPQRRLRGDEKVLAVDPPSGGDKLVEIPAKLPIAVAAQQPLTQNVEPKELPSQWMPQRTLPELAPPLIEYCHLRLPLLLTVPFWTDHTLCRH